ncbi:hypothetical protein [uncultured Bacteroides sp.]|uniref:hypothetical protein n=1 Tax=uncultured Bacteroides sp. TaxID=162156 RepID=UPI0027DE5D3F|nr:hypothetical protein [uncultured Bacteroides sp.]
MKKSYEPDGKIVQTTGFGRSKRPDKGFVCRKWKFPLWQATSFFMVERASWVW